MNNIFLWFAAIFGSGSNINREVGSEINQLPNDESEKITDKEDSLESESSERLSTENSTGGARINYKKSNYLFFSSEPFCHELNEGFSRLKTSEEKYINPNRNFSFSSQNHYSETSCDESNAPSTSLKSSPKHVRYDTDTKSLFDSSTYEYFRINHSSTNMSRSCSRSLFKERQDSSSLHKVVSGKIGKFHCAIPKKCIRDLFDKNLTKSEILPEKEQDGDTNSESLNLKYASSLNKKPTQSMPLVDIFRRKHIRKLSKFSEEKVLSQNPTLSYLLSQPIQTNRHNHSQDSKQNTAIKEYPLLTQILLRNESE
ncbi:hypothetical protein CWI37_0769p0020 [Hamiltosporidium tvaerminnensis]|uniref:Uncharacterized protein n=1 Tax=Hamiltosporidium tvaerminnensis TaxID=1176355 RepID=A0A4Q9L1H3_9MICR|nr:hypothetical protein CWI37_0769p0020 [Hamiltosporidium tvaerminnensis]